MDTASIDYIKKYTGATDVQVRCLTDKVVFVITRPDASITTELSRHCVEQMPGHAAQCVVADVLRNLGMTDEHRDMLKQEQSAQLDQVREKLEKRKQGKRRGGAGG